MTGTTVRVPPELRVVLVERARESERSLAAEVRVAIRRHLAEPLRAGVDRDRR
jgi:hypothetical protein